MRRGVLDWLLVVAWAAVIFGFSSIPSLGTDLGTWDLVLRKLAHAAVYAVLAILLYRATGRSVVAVVLAGAYAATDEYHQTLVEGRRGAPLDGVIDVLGATIGVVAWQVARGLRR